MSNESDITQQPNPSPDDKREAVGIGINLSNQLISTVLTLIAVLGVASTFILQQKSVNILFYIFAIISFISFLVSIFFGGKGINKARNQGFKGDWSLKVSKEDFNRQAIFTIIGVMSFFLIFLIGTDKESKLEKSQIDTNKLLNEQLKTSNKILEKMAKNQDEKIKSLELNILKLSDSINIKAANYYRQQCICKSRAR